MKSTIGDEWFHLCMPRMTQQVAIFPGVLIQGFRSAQALFGMFAEAQPHFVGPWYTTSLR
jgi:hypothetical protein